jgi:hypothetical protein
MSWTKARLLASSCSGATLGSLAATGASGWDVTADHARRPSARVAQNGPFDKARRIGRARFNPQSLQGPAVQKDLIVRFLERHRIIRRNLIQFFARKGFWIVRELLMAQPPML